MSVLNYVGLVPLFHRTVVSLCLRGSKIFSRGYFVGPKFFLLDVSWVQDFFSWVIRVSKIFSRRYFVGPNFFLRDTSWVTCEYISEE